VPGSAGHEVAVLEKNTQAGGRARVWEEAGFRFDMGPAWYWMPDVFDRFFARFGKTTGDYYRLRRLSPSCRVYFGPGDYLDMPAEMEDLERVFDGLSPGGAQKVREFLAQAEYKYRAGMGEYRPASR
jgi:phytoene desaturase